MDARRRISFNMNTGGGESTTGTYTIDLNGQWEKTTAVPNPDSTLYDGVYISSSNYNVNNGVSIMYIDISGYIEFTLYIRSYAESNYDYVMVSQLDQTITGSSSYSDTTLVKAHTRGNQQSGTAISNYTEVKFTNIDGGSHRITVLYRKDSSVNSGDDRGYLLIKGGVSGGTDGGGSGDTTGPINTDNYLTILALENGLTASLSTNACQYCIDGDGNWIDLPAGTATQTINQGQTLSFKGNLTPVSSTGIGTFTINKKCNLEGNCMSMLFGDYAVNNNSLDGKTYAFCHLFYNCKNLIEVIGTFLPATTLTQSCYWNMFFNCSNLTTAPELPATTLVNHCYSNMFYGCTSLTTAPELPATTLSYECYYQMFSGCTSLTTAPELPATKLGLSCYEKMFNGCTSLTTAPELPATTLIYFCYQYMFSGCTSLTTAPELPATTLVNHCYEYMFSNCSNLNYIKMLATDISATNCLSNWVSNVSSTGTFVKNLDMTSLPTGVNGIPSGWTVVDDTTKVIYYTSTDGNVVTPYATDVFGANIVSNTYSDDRGIITFDGNVTTIGDYAFNGCTKLTSVTIPDSVTSIGEGAFNRCSSLTSITIPDSVTTIGIGAFYLCKKLTSVTIPDSVTRIGSQAFGDCSSLTSITIPDSVTTISETAFEWCSSLTSVYCKATIPPTLGGNSVFDNNGSGRKIYVPYQSLDAYKTATYWSEYADDIVGYDFENDTIV